MKIRDGYVIKTVAGVPLAINTNDNVDCNSAMIQLNETGMLLWEKLTLGAEKDALVSCLLNTYDVAKEVAIQDTEAFLAFLEQAGVLEA